MLANRKTMSCREDGWAKYKTKIKQNKKVKKDRKEKKEKKNES